MNKAMRRHDRITASAEAFFGQRVRELSFPGGTSRASLRLHFDDKTVIGSLRPNFRRTHIEAHILQELAPYCDDIPICYGVDGDIMFQSDVGARRLNQEIHRVSGDQRRALAEEAVASIFRIHAAARKTDLAQTMPHLGNNRGWVENVVHDVDVLAPVLDRPIPVSYPRSDLADYLVPPATQFVKWDCRSGNAALGDDDHLRWFDFEYAGVRHGAEDFAWLIGDESWPLDGATMLDILSDGFDPGCGHAKIAWMDYLTVYTVLHCIQRLKLILTEVQARGWRDPEEIVARDDVGRHPAFAAQLAVTAAQLADRHRTTAMLVPHLEAAQRRFLEVEVQAQPGPVRG